MSATIRSYDALDIVAGGAQQPGFGSMHVPIHEATITGGTNIIPGRQIPIPAGEKVVIWEWADTSGFESFKFRIIGAGFLRVAFLVEQTTNGEVDETPNGKPVWMHLNKSCVNAFSLDSDRCLSHDTDATVDGDTAGEPTLWSASSTFEGVISKVMVWNIGTDTVNIEMHVIQ